MIPKGYHKHPGCTGLANRPVMEQQDNLEEAQKLLNNIHCPTCLNLLGVDATKDRAEAAAEIEWQKARQHYFRRVAHYIQARSQAVKYGGSKFVGGPDSFVPEGGNLDD